MASTRQIKRRIVASQNISKITKAMEMVAASKMKRAQDQAVATRPYSRALEASLHKVGESTDQSLHPLLERHGSGLEIIVLISTDKGLCGGLNTNLFKSLLAEYRHFSRPKIVAVGKKAVAFCRLMGLEIHAQFTELPDKLNPADILPISSLLMQGFMNKEFKSVSLLYMDFINTLSQQVRFTPLLPLSQTETEIDSQTPAPELRSDYSFEPSAQEILNQLLPYYLENTVYQTFLEAKASEHSARMVAMKNASENATELVSELKLLFNKSRQASITSELLDITTAALTIS
jgi:F-type H+-transporting ATPase subunit gamma